jgi:hypothetical protein
MIFEFKQMKQAEAFVQEVKERFDLDGRVFDDEEEAYLHDPHPFQVTGLAVHIDRVEIDSGRAEVKKCMKRFGLTREMIEEQEAEYPSQPYPYGRDTTVRVAAER